MVKFNHYGTSHKGLRQNNQDTWTSFTNKEGTLFVVVADGMGGHIGGEMCSQLTANIMKRFFNAIELKGKTTQQISFTATKAVKYLSKKLEQYSEEHPDLIDMGTTLNMNIFLDDYFLNLNVGDSRTTKFTKHKNVQISEDQNMATAAKKDPSLAKWKNHTNLLTSSIGPKKTTTLEIVSTEYDKKGYVFMTTDGIHGYISVKDTHKIINGKESLQEKVDSIIETSLTNGSTDNLTGVLIQYEK